MLPARDPAADEAESLARMLLARRQAAIALADSGELQALEALIAVGRAGGPGQASALDALALRPPSSAVLGGVALTTTGMIALAAEVGDLRALGGILGDLRASDPGLRAAALAALGRMGDARVLEPARQAANDKDPRVRLAAAEALARLGAPDAGKVLEALIAQDATARDALRIAALVSDEGVTKAAAARAAASASPDLRQAAVVALGRQDNAGSVAALAALVADVRLQGDAVDALARSPSPNAMAAIEALGEAPGTRRLAARAYLVRRAVRDERSASLDALLVTLAASRQAADRAVAQEALVALGEEPLERALADPDPRVRRVAAMGSLALEEPARAKALAGRLAVETDAVTRMVLELGLAGSDPGGAMPTLSLVDRAEAGGPDAPLAALALARRADEELQPKVDALLRSPDPLMRAHVARGLAGSRAPDVVGRLAHAYLWEADTDVRRALVGALAAHAPGAPARREALVLAAHLDPDAVVQTTARAALAGARASRTGPFLASELVSAAASDLHGPSGAKEVAWLRVVPAEGASLPADLTAALVDANGMAWPIAFDDDGYALLPGLPAGEAHLRLAPRVPAYDPR